MKLSSIPCVFAAALLAVIQINNSAEAKEKPTIKTEDIEKAGQFVCGLKTGSEDEAVDAIKALGLQIVLRSDGLNGFVICRCKDELKKETLNKLLEHKSIRYVEPDPPVMRPAAD